MVDAIKISMVPSHEKNYKYFVGYNDNDYKIKPFWMMLPKTATYIESYDGETK